MRFGGLEYGRKWINWILVQRKGEWIKLPCNLDGRAINAHDKGWHQSYDNVSKDIGLGYVLDKDDGLFFVDIDKCYDGQQWSPLALDLVNRLQGCFVEVSQSGNGLHIIGMGKVPEDIGVKGNGFDLYRSGRFIALTGLSSSGNAWFKAQEGIDGILRDYTFNVPAAVRTDVTLRTSPVDEYTGDWSDEELLQVIQRAEAKNPDKMLGNKAKFIDLWERNETELAKIYPPSDANKTINQSSADLALCNILCFWTGNDHERVDRLFRQSKLMRPKWERNDYRTYTLSNSSCENVYKKVSESQMNEIAIGTPFMTINDMVENFKDYVYVAELNKIFDPKELLFMDQQRFNVMHGGYIYCMDMEGRTTNSTAWSILTKCQKPVIQKAARVCFRPTLPYGIVGNSTFNLYKPVPTPCVRGDVSLFINQINKMFGNENDRKIILSYMAAVVQHKGVKFSWAPVLQGVEGNGKSFLNDCVYEAIGSTYATVTKGEALGKDFNAFLMNRLFVGVEEVHYSGNGDLMESMKPVITNKKIQMEKKGVDKIQYDNMANFILNTNHKDAIRKTANDRRYAIFYTEQQTKEDLVKWGMTQEYFYNLYNWAEKQNGYAMIHDYLANYPIEDSYNPAKFCRVAPQTSSHYEAVENSKSAPEQAVTEAVESDTIGFRQHLISSIKATELLRSWRITGRTVGKILGEMGYVNHGRFSSTLVAEGGRPQLWVKPEFIGHHQDLFEIYKSINYL